MGFARSGRSCSIVLIAIGWAAMAVLSLDTLSDSGRAVLAESKAGSASSTQVSSVRMSTNEVVEDLIGQSLSLADELAADLLLRIAAAGVISDPDRHKSVIEDAFIFAARSRYPTKLRAFSGSVVDTRSGYVSNALMNGMDGLSLRCRSIGAMVDVDRVRAREMFEELPRLDLPPIECSEPLLPDVSIYYECLEKLARRGFSQDELTSGENVFFLSRFIGAIESPVQVAPAARLVSLAPANPSQLESLVDAFAGALSKIVQDSRSFSESRMHMEMARLLERCQTEGVSRTALLEAYREYLLNQLNTEHCGDTTIARASASRYDDWIKPFNEQLARFADPTGKEVHPIDASLIRASRNDQRAIVHPYWTSPKARESLRASQQLRFAGGDRELDVKQKESQEWQWQLNQFISGIRGWTAGDEATDEDYFHQKSVVLVSTVTLAPPGRSRAGILSEAVSFIVDSDLQTRNAPEWFLHASRLLKMIEDQPAADRQSALEILRRSRSSALALLAQLHEMTRERSD